MTNADLASTFASREARVMRPLAVLTNLAFVSYGVLAWLPPVLALHLLLLPINLWRWAESCGADLKELRVRLDRMSSALVAAALVMLPLLAV